MARESSPGFSGSVAPQILPKASRALVLRGALPREVAEASERGALNGRAEENDDIVLGGECIAEGLQAPVEIGFRDICRAARRQLAYGRRFFSSSKEHRGLGLAVE